MSDFNQRNDARHTATHRTEKIINIPSDANGRPLKVTEFYGKNVFDIKKAKGIPESVKKEIIEVSISGKLLQKEHAEIVAKSVTDWAISNGATHFCHWFQPLTGGTAEKHDAFIDINGNNEPVEKLSAAQLMQGEPDASSFPNGGARSTFEARGYTAWDITSPMFIMDGFHGKTLCIPTAFVSYFGEALDIKTPLLRSISKIDRAATKFMHLCGEKDVKNVSVTCGAEQEYFLIDKAFVAARPDLVMTGKTLFGSLSAKNQQLDDHYFGKIPQRVLAFMEELEIELYKLGIPAKTRHNEVAPGQFEMAPIFCDSNVAADNNQLIMAMIREVAENHDFVALLHEKPFAGINGSGKHLNWSMGTNTGINLLEPGKEPHSNYRFLATVAVIVEAVNRHAGAIRAAIAGHGNDHRLGANEAPPSIISIFLGDTLTKIFTAIGKGSTFDPGRNNTLELGADQLAHLLKDNTDRNRTSPFAFTGNKFEFRAVGSSASIGFPLSILNAAVCEVLTESNLILHELLESGKSVDDALHELTRKWITSSQKVIFNGDGYAKEWVVEAEKRGLPNYRTSPQALEVFNDPVQTKFLLDSGIFTKNEINTRYNVLLEKYITHREIEFSTLKTMVNQYVIPAAITYKEKLSTVIERQKNIGLECSVEVELYKKINFAMESLSVNIINLNNKLDELGEDEAHKASTISKALMPLSEEIATHCNQLEDLIDDDVWKLPKYSDMLFLR